MEPTSNDMGLRVTRVPNGVEVGVAGKEKTYLVAVPPSESEEPVKITFEFGYMALPDLVTAHIPHPPQEAVAPSNSKSNNDAAADTNLDRELDMANSCNRTESSDDEKESSGSETSRYSRVSSENQDGQADPSDVADVDDEVDALWMAAMEVDNDEDVHPSEIQNTRAGPSDVADVDDIGMEERPGLSDEVDVDVETVDEGVGALVGPLGREVRRRDVGGGDEWTKADRNFRMVGCVDEHAQNYIVEEILAVRFKQTPEYQVKWAGWSKNFNSWTPASEMNDLDTSRFMVERRQDLKRKNDLKPEYLS